jgi:predicted nucleic acid-binding protein
VKVLLDTSAFIALAFPEDSHHAEALEKQDRIRREKIPIWTSNAVLYECFTWLAIKAGPRAASGFGKKVLEQSPELQIVYLARDDETAALKVLEKYPEIALSFVDAANIHLLRSRQLDALFAFDGHFRQCNQPLF